MLYHRGSKRVEDSKFYLARNGLGLQVVVGGSVPDSDILGKIMVVLFMPTEVRPTDSRRHTVHAASGLYVARSMDFVLLLCYACLAEYGRG